MTSEPAVPAPYQDRKTALIVFGVFELLLALLLAAITLLSVVTLLAVRAKSAGGPTVALWSVLVLAGMAVAAAWLGIGTILARRWARALNLCLGWIWLVCGLLGSLSLVWILPEFDRSMRLTAAQSGQHLTEGMMLAMKSSMIGMVLVMYVVIPSALVLFFRAENVRRTCEARDPVRRWTDACPLRVLGLVLLFGVGTLSVALLSPLYGRALPVFGHVLSGTPAILVLLAFAALSAWIACGLYRLKRSAYFTALGVVLLGGLNTFISFYGSNLIAYYEKLGLGRDELRAIESSAASSAAVAWLGAFGCFVLLCYLAWLHPVFGAAKTEK
ncbi:hypothetical protein [Opitutus sp. ER46]|uniref:hypothetical protein n=1 Tax=Opitutus sp. ER46 TaxID=2161864 RepID=UPI000D32500E|nr:hypothetical protein [Opitutus sp. ER46]PTX97951.1 hypothetical protein DB354_06660 [Opitutus sp. ER46]